MPSRTSTRIRSAGRPENRVRYLGPYQTGSTPSIEDLVRASTPVTKLALASCLNDLKRAEAEFMSTLPGAHVLRSADLTEGVKAKMRAAYAQRSDAVKARLTAMVQSSPAGRFDLCPSCSLDGANEIDHYLPQSRYPELSLAPWNLIPICSTCNRRKGNRVADKDGRRQFLLATHDDSTVSRLIHAEISFTGTAHVRFYIRTVENDKDDGLAVAGRHFQALNLATRYAKRATAHLSQMKNGLRRATPANIRRNITGGLCNARTSEPVNGWRLSSYEAMVAELDEIVRWVTDGGS